MVSDDYNGNLSSAQPRACAVVRTTSVENHIAGQNNYLTPKLSNAKIIQHQNVFAIQHQLTMVWRADGSCVVFLLVGDGG